MIYVFYFSNIYKYKAIYIIRGGYQMKKIEDFTPDELVTLSSTIGILISRKTTVIQRFVIATFLSDISQTLIITVAQANLIASLDSNLSSTNNDLQKQIDELKKHINELEDGKTDNP